MMKYNRFITALVLVLAMGMTSCNNNTPEAVAEKFLNSFFHMEYEKARQVSTDRTKELVNLMEQFSIQKPDSVRQNAKKIAIKIVNIKEDGDNAVVTYTMSSEPGEQKLKLIKQNGTWLVSHSKQDDLGDEEYDDADEADETAPVQ